MTLPFSATAMPLNLSCLHWALFPEDRELTLRAHQADADDIMTIRIIRAFFARCLGLPTPGKIDDYFPRLDRGTIQLGSLETVAADGAKIDDEAEDETERFGYMMKRIGRMGMQRLRTLNFEGSDFEVSDVWGSIQRVLDRQCANVGFRGPLQNHMILGNNRSCTKSIDVFSRFRDLIPVTTFRGPEQEFPGEVYGRFYSSADTD